MMTLTPEELAEIEARFDDFDPATATAYTPGTDELPPDLLLVRAQAARDFHLRQADSVMRAAVATARAEGMSWHRIGVQLGTTGEAARQRYSAA
jgi:hypothetical protein